MPQHAQSSCGLRTSWLRHVKCCCVARLWHSNMCCVCRPAGLDLIWRIYLGTEDQAVATYTSNLLLTLYHCQHMYEGCHVFRNALVK